MAQEEEAVLGKEVDGVEAEELVRELPESRALEAQLESKRQQNTYRPQLKTRPVKKQIERGEEGIVAALCAWIVDHQIGIAMNLFLLLSLTHICFPKARQYTRKFYWISHYNPESGRYALGWSDACMVFSWFTIFTGVRIFVMDYIMTPLAQSVGLQKKDKVRFAEQAWLLLYATISWSMGLYIIYTSDYWMDLRKLWSPNPDRELDGRVKWYYLIQYAFWVQQIVVVNIEARRRDYAQMLTHHIVTCTLMFTSYGYHYTKVGTVILCLMDTSDIALPAAKLLKYLKYRTACDVGFGVFIFLWIITRHLLYLRVVYSIYKDLPDVTDLGCYVGSNQNLQGPFEAPDRFMHFLTPFRDPEGVVCQTQGTTNAFITLLMFLQAILVLWFAMIVRVAVKVLRGDGADDVRSDDEDEETEEEIPEYDDEEKYANGQQNYIEVPPLEEDVGVEDINLNGRKTSPARLSTRRGHGMASGVSLPSDKKDLLGRIGCDKGS